MTTARAHHTATLLNDGRVLIAGGIAAAAVGVPYLDSAELYDLATHTFTATGTMTAPRWYNTATLLSNGKVLIAGGCTTGDNLSSTEIYDPSSGTFTPTGSMTTGHCDAIGTLLANGNVLILPTDQSTGYSDAEVFDPLSGTFHAVPWPAAAQGWGAATANLLSNGKVLVTVSDNTYCLHPTPDSQLYDPGTETFSDAGNTIGDRCLSNGSLLSAGTVLITGTYAPDAENPNELYDPASGRSGRGW